VLYSAAFVPFARQILILFTTVLAVCTVAASAPARPTTAEAELIRAVNQVRGQHRLAPLRVDLRLERAARAYSKSMLGTGRFAHGDVRGRLVRYGARGPVFGENLAWAVGSRASAGAIVQMWMASPPHRANLLRPGFRRVGMGRVVGTFSGYGGAAVVTANFAGR
jgi:uncharacterized protein YkwD